MNSLLYDIYVYSSIILYSVYIYLIFTRLVTWLILPVVICLPQRLSHACLSISTILRNCVQLLISVRMSWRVLFSMGSRSNSRANTCRPFVCGLDPVSLLYLLSPSPCAYAYLDMRGSFHFLPYQLSTVVSWTPVALTGDGESGFDSGEGAWETATTSKEGSRRANYPLLTQGGSDKNEQGRALRVGPLEWVWVTSPHKDQLEGKSGASSRGNSSSKSVYASCCSWKARSWISGLVLRYPQTGLLSLVCCFQSTLTDEYFWNIHLIYFEQLRVFQADVYVCRA